MSETQTFDPNREIAASQGGSTEAPETVAEIGPREEIKKVVTEDKAAENKGSLNFQKARLFEVEATDLNDKDRSVRYVAKVDAPGKDKVYRRTFRFVVPESDRLGFLQNRPTEKIKFTTEELVKHYQKYRGEHRGIRKNWMQADWMSDEKFREQLGEWGYLPAGENEWERPAAQSVEQEIAGMLKDNNYDLSPKAIAVEQSLGKAKDRQIVFNIDHRSFKYPLQEVKNRVETVLGLLNEGVLPLVEKYRAMSFGDIKKISDPDERELALQTLGIFAGIPTKALKLANTWVQKDRGNVLLDGYEAAKAKQEKQRDSGRRRRGNFTPPDEVYIFETLGLRLRSGTNSIATEAVEQALVQRLHREPIKYEQAKDPLDVAKEFVKGLNLVRLGFKGLQKKIDELDASDKQKGMVYLAACLETGYSPRRAVDDLDKKEISRGISSLEIFRTSARVALELLKEKARNKNFVDYSDGEYFEKGQDVVFKDPSDKRSGAFVAKRRVQAGTGAQFVDVAIIRQAKAGQQQQKDRIFHLPISDNSVVASLENAKELRRQVSGIFLDRQQAGQRLSFVPHIELIKSRTKTNPNFRLSLGTAQAEVDYKSLYNTLSFQNKVEAELVKAIYSDSKKADSGAWAKLPEWKKQAVYKFQDIVSYSGLPSLTEQMVVQELINRLSRAKTAAPVVGKDRRVLKTRVKEAPVKVVKSHIKPIGSISPEALTALSKLNQPKERAKFKVEKQKAVKKK